MFPRDMVCLRNISVDTLHKGDTEDNNNNNNNNNNNSADPLCFIRAGSVYSGPQIETNPRKSLGKLDVRSAVSKSSDHRGTFLQVSQY